ncbi:MAG TPA: phosphoribosyltransferase [Thermoanaerobaculia bacterium]
MRYEPFADRAEAGKLLGAEVVRRVGKRQDLVVLALPRGGVPVGYQVARALDAPLDVFIVRKLGVPGQEELAMGAIASGGVRVLNDEVLRYVPVPTSTIERVAEFEARELERRERAYRRDRPPLDVTGKTVVIVDDGLATGSTMRAAVEALQKMKPKEIVVAVPVAAPSTCAEFQSIVDEMICLRTPEPFQSVGLWYRDFRQTTDEEVEELLTIRTNTTPGIPR